MNRQKNRDPIPLPHWAVAAERLSGWDRVREIVAEAEATGHEGYGVLTACQARELLIGHTPMNASAAFERLKDTTDYGLQVQRAKRAEDELAKARQDLAVYHDIEDQLDDERVNRRHAEARAAAFAQTLTMVMAECDREIAHLSSIARTPYGDHSLYMWQKFAALLPTKETP